MFIIIIIKLPIIIKGAKRPAIIANNVTSHFMLGTCFCAESSVAVKTGGCFPGQSLVHVLGRGQVRMSDLRIGDRALAFDISTNQLVYSEVLLFMHRYDDISATFKEAQTANGHRITLTSSHLIYVVNKATNSLEAVFADKLNQGTDLISVMSVQEVAHKSEIINVTSVIRRGVYAPVTQHGTIFVDDILVSCYGLLPSHTVAHAAFAPVRWFHTLVSKFSANQMMLNNHQNVTTSHDVHSASPDEHSQDLHWYARLLYQVGYWLIPSERQL